MEWWSVVKQAISYGRYVTDQVVTLSARTAVLSHFVALSILFLVYMRWKKLIYIIYTVMVKIGVIVDRYYVPSCSFIREIHWSDFCVAKTTKTNFVKSSINSLEELKKKW